MANVELKRMQQIYGTRDEFATIDPYLLPGELAIQTDDRIIKFGSTTVSRWSQCKEFTIDWPNIRNVPSEVSTAAKSAYELYVDEFNKEHEDDEPVPTAPTLSEWLASLVGPQGAQGPQGEQGEQGPKGADGKSAYEVYVDVFREEHKDDDEVPEDPTVDEYIASLKGPTGATGKDAYEVYKAQYEADNPGETALTRAAWLASLKGANGASAYEVFKAQHPDSELDEDGWLASLKGANGASALEIAQRDDPTLTEETFLASLKGDKGDKGDQGEPFEIKKIFNTVAEMADEGAELLADGVTPLTIGQFVLVTTADDTDEDNGKLYIYLGEEVTDATSGTHFRFVVDMSVAGVQGPKGDTGDTGATGATGMSAYQVYLAQFQIDHADDVVDEDHPAAVPLTQAEWLESLIGPQGEQGVKGDTGAEGAEGKDAYEVYRAAFEAEHASDPEPIPSPMSKDDWLASLVGAKGATGNSAYEVYVANFNTAHEGDDPMPEPLTESEWLASLKGEDATVTILEDGVVIEHLVGEKVTVMNGRDGDQGPKGDTGNDAYETYVAYQLSIGTSEDDILDRAGWLASLKGAQGIQGPKGDTGAPFGIKKIFTTVAALANADATDLPDGGTLEIGDFVIIETADPNDVDNGKVYTYTGEVNAETGVAFSFVVDMSVASTVQGPVGKSAYQSAVDTGVFTGTEQEFAEQVVEGNANAIEKLRSACYRMKAILEYVADTAHVDIDESIWTALENDLSSSGSSSSDEGEGE